MDIFEAILVAIVAITIAATAVSAIVITPEKHYKFVSLLGKYQKTLKSGLGFKIPFLTKIDYEVYLGLQSLAVSLTPKTKDQVTFSMNLNVQYRISDEINDAYRIMYDIDDYRRIMAENATNESIAVANGIGIEDVFNQKEQITDKVKSTLQHFFKPYGLTIENVVCDDPKLPAELERTNNEVMQAQRSSEAAKYVAIRHRVEKVGIAEAEGESVKIRMHNLAEARMDYAKNSAESVKLLTSAGCSPDASLAFLNRIGDQDAMISVARYGNTVVVPAGESQSNLASGSVSALLSLLNTDPKKTKDTPPVTEPAEVPDAPADDLTEPGSVDKETEIEPVA